MSLTISKGHKTDGRTAEDARIDTRKLSIDEALQLCISRSPLTVWRRRSDTVYIQRIARMLSERNCVGNERIRVRHTGRLGKVDHRVSIVLLCARVCVSEKRIDAIDASKLNTRLSREDVSTTNELQT